jgi:hypothetical protein
MPPKRVPKSASRKNTPVSPPKAASSVADSPKRIRRGRGESREDEVRAVSVELGLGAVEEVDEDAAAAAAHITVPESSGASDDSQHSSVTQGELDGLEYDFIVDSLADLHREALKIIEIFANLTPAIFSALINDLSDPTSKPSNRLRYQYTKLQATFQNFETGKRIYIIPQTIVRKLDGGAWEDVQDGKWRPDAVLYLANLAQLICGTFLGDRDEDDLDTYFGALMKYFPRIFTPVEQGGRFTTQHVALAQSFERASRTQHFIHIARRDGRKASYDPGDMLRELFPDDTGMYHSSFCRIC